MVSASASPAVVDRSLGEGYEASAPDCGSNEQTVSPDPGYTDAWLSRTGYWPISGFPKAFTANREPEHPWWRVMCLTGVDYFSTLGYQPGIAFLAAGLLSPLATLVLVLVTLFGALPVYSRVAEASPNGQGSIGMLEKLFPQWSGKTFVLILLGFATTDFVITMTLSAADAAAHVTHNPFTPDWLKSQMAVTLVLLGILGAIFLKGFREAINVAVVLVASYLALNLVVTAVAIREVLRHPHILPNWKDALFAQHGNPLAMLGISLVLFPKLALGLSGFETGVAVMPLIEGAGSRRTHPQYAQAAVHGGRHHERVPDRHQPGDDSADSACRVSGRRRGERPRPGLPGTQVSRKRLRIALRRQHDSDPRVRGRVRHGRPAQSDSALSAAIRHGAGMGAGIAAAGAGLHGGRVCRHHSFPRQCGCAGRRLCHRRAGVDDVGGVRGDDFGVEQAAALALSADLAGVRLHHGAEHLRASGGHQDRVVLHRRHDRDLAGLARAALDGTANPRRRTG